MNSRKQSSFNPHSNLLLRKMAQDGIMDQVKKAISSIEKFIEVVSGISSSPITKEMISEAKKMAEDLKAGIENLIKNPEEMKVRVQELISSIESAKQLISYFVKDQALKNALNQAANNAKEMLVQLNQMLDRLK